MTRETLRRPFQTLQPTIGWRCISKHDLTCAFFAPIEVQDLSWALTCSLSFCPIMPTVGCDPANVIQMSCVTRPRLRYDRQRSACEHCCREEPLCCWDPWQKCIMESDGQGWRERHSIAKGSCSQIHLGRNSVEYFTLSVSVSSRNKVLCVFINWIQMHHMSFVAVLSFSFDVQGQTVEHLWHLYAW